jgi:hypothetical protein
MIEINQSVFGVLGLIGALALTFAWPLGSRRGNHILRYFRSKVYRMTHPYYWYGRYYRRRRRSY